VGVLFYLKPDGQYILAVDDGMAVFYVTFCRKERPLSFQNVTQHNNEHKHSHNSVTN
jgi:hypothetical protein